MRITNRSAVHEGAGLDPPFSRGKMASRVVSGAHFVSEPLDTYSHVLLDA